MRYSISACSYYKLMTRKLLNMPQDFGVEIFYEYGSQDMWNSFMAELSAHGFDGFSIHAPFAFIDITAQCDETKLFDTLKRPFDLYHRYNGEFYVLHTYGASVCTEDPLRQSDFRERSMERLYKFNEICKAEGVRLGAENLCDGKIPLYNEEEFLNLFHQIPDMSCVLDVGHALAAKMDIANLQCRLRERICAYHLHNNDGVSDLHERLQIGIMDWQSFAENCVRYTPEAVGVLEYLKYQDFAVYKEDRAYLDNLLRAARAESGGV